MLRWISATFSRSRSTKIGPLGPPAQRLQPERPGAGEEVDDRPARPSASPRMLKSDSRTRSLVGLVSAAPFGPSILWPRAGPR